MDLEYLISSLNQECLDPDPLRVFSLANNIAIYCHKVVLESLEILLHTQFLADRCETEVLCTLSAQSQTILDELLHNPTSNTFQAAMVDDGIHTFVYSFLQYRNDVKGGSQGKHSTVLAFLHGPCMVTSFSDTCCETELFHSVCTVPL